MPGSGRVGRAAKIGVAPGSVINQQVLGTRVDITSQSRVGKGDLGQNPRNIRILLQALRDELDHKLDDERDDKIDVAPGSARG